MNDNVGKNILYSSISNLLPALFTFVFWFVAAKISGSESIGIASVIASFVMIVVNVFTLNINVGMKSELGMSFHSQNMAKFKQQFTSVIIFVLAGAVVSSVLISIPQFAFLNFGIGYKYTWLVIAMIFSFSFQYIFQESLVVLNRSNKLVIPALVGSLIRFPILIIFVEFLNLPQFGTVMAYAVLLFISSIIYGVYCWNAIRVSRSKATINLGSNMKILIRASLVSWIPQIISVVGSQLSIISVYAIHGATASGQFYIPMAIYSIIFFVISGITRVLHPLIAGTKEVVDQVRYISKSIKMAYIFTIPISIPLLFFGKDYLGLLGSDFALGETTMAIFVITMPVSIVNEIVYYFLYGKGDNRSVLFLGLIGNTTRIAGYFLVVPTYGGIGAALVFLGGSIVQLIPTMWMSKKYLLRMNYKQYLTISGSSIFIGLLFWYVHENFIISSFAIIIISFFIYIKIGIFTIDDLHSVVFSIFSKNKAEPVYKTLSKIMEKLQ